MNIIYDGSDQYHSPKSAAEYIRKILNDPDHNFTDYDLELIQNLSKLINQLDPNQPVIEFVEVENDDDTR